jgi:hypothetical protein
LRLLITRTPLKKPKLKLELCPSHPPFVILKPETMLKAALNKSVVDYINWKCKVRVIIY